VSLRLLRQAVACCPVAHPRPSVRAGCGRCRHRL